MGDERIEKGVDMVAPQHPEPFHASHPVLSPHREAEQITDAFYLLEHFSHEGRVPVGHERQPVLRTEKPLEVCGTIPLGIQSADNRTDARSCHIVDGNMGTLYLLQYSYGRCPLGTASAKDKSHPGARLPAFPLLLCRCGQRTVQQDQKYKKHLLHDGKSTVFSREKSSTFSFLFLFPFPLREKPGARDDPPDGMNGTDRGRRQLAGPGGDRPEK